MHRETEMFHVGVRNKTMKAYSCEADSVPVARRTGCGEVEGVADGEGSGTRGGKREWANRAVAGRRCDGTTP